jgi:hypothetical protein
MPDLMFNEIIFSIASTGVVVVMAVVLWLRVSKVDPIFQTIV